MPDAPVSSMKVLFSCNIIMSILLTKPILLVGCGEGSAFNLDTFALSIYDASEERNWSGLESVTCLKFVKCEYVLCQVMMEDDLNK